jgi:putative transcriptional regulator
MTGSIWFAYAKNVQGDLYAGPITATGGFDENGDRRVNEQAFEELLQSVRDMGRHLRGETVPGVRATQGAGLDVEAIRQKSGLSQSEFAQLIGVTTKTVRTWEARQARPSGPAKMLLRMVADHPEFLRAL